MKCLSLYGLKSQNTNAQTRIESLPKKPVDPGFEPSPLGQKSVAQQIVLPQRKLFMTKSLTFVCKASMTRYVLETVWRFQAFVQLPANRLIIPS